MKKNILNLDGVVTLTKQQQKSINGGNVEGRNLYATGDFYYDNGRAVGCGCTWEVKQGSNWIKQSGPCPTSLEYSCLIPKADLKDLGLLAP